MCELAHRAVVGQRLAVSVQVPLLLVPFAPFAVIADVIVVLYLCSLYHISFRWLQQNGLCVFCTYQGSFVLVVLTRSLVFAYLSFVYLAYAFIFISKCAVPALVVSFAPRHSLTYKLQ